uniref:Bicaudal D-related protein 1 n=1 Tax=Phallusia mammillata TaxID=59560 RepID=A0A6F9D6U2_9ASCI|nr:bicaudal D-related protein 1 [Phallusia mammillata]
MRQLIGKLKAVKANSENIKMETECATILQTSSMEDSLFPYLGDSYSSVNGSHAAAMRSRQYSSTGDEQSDLEADSMPESQMELTEADVYTQLEHKERDLILAAELGKSLLEKNEELSRENERLQQEYHEHLEALEQEKFDLRQRLEYKSSECEASAVQLNGDIMRTQEELEERKAMLAATEREKTRAIEELTEQNQKLLTQLQLASDAELQLSAQVQQLRKEFLERTNSTNVKILQLENLKEEIAQGTESRVELESHYDVMKDETLQMREELASASERIHHLERQLHDRERELKRVAVELNDAHVSNRQLQIRVDELREEISLQMSFNSHGNSSSLMSELEESGVDQCEVFDFGTPVTSPNKDVSRGQEAESEINKSKNADDFSSSPPTPTPEQGFSLDDISPEMSLRCYRALMNGVNNCHHQLFELKQDMWEAYQRVETVCTCLRSFVHKQNVDMTVENGDQSTNSPTPRDDRPMSPTSGGSMNLAKALDELSGLAQEAVRLKVLCETPDSDIVRMLKDQHKAVTQERDDAVASKNLLEVNLARAKVDLMAVNSQLLEAIQQKLHQQTELEAWQDDMEQMIQKALTDRSNATKLRRVQNPTNEPSQPARTSWFSFRRTRNNSVGESAKSTTSSSSDVTLSNSTQASPASDRKSNTSSTETETNTSAPSRFASWLRRKQTPVEPQPDVTDNDVAPI